MKIVDTSGRILTERPDYTKGRLLQDPDNPGTMVFSPWDEIPLREEENAEYGDPLKMELESIDTRLAELDYIGIKIATGRGTREEYASEIVEMQTLAERKNVIRARLREVSIHE